MQPKKTHFQEVAGTSREIFSFLFFYHCLKERLGLEKRDGTMAETYRVTVNQSTYRAPPVNADRTYNAEELLGYLIGMFISLHGDPNDLDKTGELPFEKNVQVKSFDGQLDLSAILRAPENSRIMSAGEEAFEMDPDYFAEELGNRWYLPYAVKLATEYGNYLIQFNSKDFMAGLADALIDLGINPNPRSGFISSTRTNPRFI
jgi:hypothetical protein